MTENSIVRVESKIAYLEEAIDELNRVVLKQEQSLRDLQSLCAQLAMRIRAQGELPEDEEPESERPPHY